ncbi:aminotransferase class V-fold PLP-dependent enzyme [Gordonia sp. TBRC 11910]|uniref:Aminotransferase class V-fold PLP-dependent enzyme n=1 Tax=Gordonia asplenii TaxID=2725283 RepID=A0A848KXF0_9ACTN|nr:aminotransferase class V-fold PLP-dependent enzyme [Gordonia asplenii]NMO00871.1 aminotransferase class V-fold PLP-dependent enzyme [Gordonia asplenii]
MSLALESQWPVLDLQEWAGEIIARHTGAEAGWVSCGAGAGLSLAAAACIAGTDPVLTSTLPNAGGAAREIIIQRSHRQSYDRVFLLAGASIREIGYPDSDGIGGTYEWELEAAIGAETAAVAYSAHAEKSGISLKRICELAHAHDLPVIVDAADALPPVANLTRFIAEGADLVAFSGGKALGGPQTSGILAGRKHLIESVRMQALDMYVDPAAWTQRYGELPPHHGIGRVMKVGKEQIFGLVAALEQFANTDHDRICADYVEWLLKLRGAIGAGVVDRSSSYYPRLVLTTSNEGARTIATLLSRCEPPIIVRHHTLARGEVVICPESVDEIDRNHLVTCLQSALRLNSTEVH